MSSKIVSILSQYASMLTPIDMGRGNMLSEIGKAAIGDRIVDTLSILTNPNPALGRKARWGLFAQRLGLNLLDWFVSNIGQFILTNALTLYNFNWNATDAEIEAQIKASENMAYNQAGQLAATGLVYSIGIGATAKASVRWPTIWFKTALEVAEEGGEETRAQIRQFLIASRNAMGSALMLSAFLTGRRLIQGAQTDRREPWIASDQLDKLIEKNPNEKMKQFWEGFKDQTEDALLELGYIINNGMLSNWRMHVEGMKQALGEKHLVKVTPDKETQESFIMYGSEEELKPAITTALATSTITQNKDFGQFVGYPIEEYIKAKPHTRQLQIVWEERQQPPYQVIDGGKVRRSKQAVYSIPDAKMGLSWQQIKTAAKAWNWGKFRCTANLTGGRQMQVYGASPAEAEDKLRELLTLSTAEILTLSITEEKDRNAKLKKEQRRLYPAYVTLTVRKETIDPANSDYTDLTGTGYSEKRQRVPLWTDNAPSTWNSAL